MNLSCLGENVDLQVRILTRVRSLSSTSQNSELYVDILGCNSDFCVVCQNSEFKLRILCCTRQNTELCYVRILSWVRIQLTDTIALLCDSCKIVVRFWNFMALKVYVISYQNHKMTDFVQDEECKDDQIAIIVFWTIMPAAIIFEFITG